MVGQVKYVFNQVAGFGELTAMSQEPQRAAAAVGERNLSQNHPTDPLECQGR